MPNAKPDEPKVETTVFHLHFNIPSDRCMGLVVSRPDPPSYSYSRLATRYMKSGESPIWHLLTQGPVPTL